MPTITSAQHRTAMRISAEMARTGFSLPGSIAYRSTSCGKSNCHCTADPPVLHGPYPTWTRKVAGKTVTRRLTEDQYATYRTWFEAAQRHRSLLGELEDLSLAIIEAELRPLVDSGFKPRAGRARKTPAT